MTDKLPPGLLALFAPRPALRYVPPSDHAPQDRHTSLIDPVSSFLPDLATYPEDHPYTPTESWLQMRDRKKLEKAEAAKYTVTDGYTNNYKPNEDPQVKGDAFKTLFVARLPYDITVADLEREFGRFGAIERIRIVEDSTAAADAPLKKKMRGYAFIVFERERDLKAAYKESEGVRIKDRKILVDVERGRTVAKWRPRRFGGGLGGRGYTKEPVMRPNYGGGMGAPMGPGGYRGMGSRGGYDGGGRGGYGGGRGGYGDRGGSRGGFQGGRGGGDFGPRAGGRGGIGYQNGGGGGGYGGGAPRGGYNDRGPSNYGGGGRGGYSGGGGGGYGGGGYQSGSNMEPVAPRGGRDEGGYGRRDDGYQSRDGPPRGMKREYDNGGGYDDSRKQRRYD